MKAKERMAIPRQYPEELTNPRSQPVFAMQKTKMHTGLSCSE